MCTMTYQETIAYLFRQLPMYQRQGATAFKKDLTNIIALTDAIGRPQEQFKSIHIAGTNGKGSTAHILAAILQKAGYSTGLYTSPHYKDFRERIKINGLFIPEQTVVDFVQNNQDNFKKIKPSFFEMTVAMAFDYFAQQKVDIAIIETGLGGRLDSTNIIEPLFSVITNIGWDHEAMLGNTLPKIAAEKAGIIKKNRAVIIGQHQQATDHVFEQKAAKEQAPLYFAADLVQLERTNSALEQIEYKLDSTLAFLQAIQSLKTDLIGAYQKYNLQTALACCKLLIQHGFDLNTNHIKAACTSVIPTSKLMGRWQILAKHPLTIAESGHNRDGIAFLMKGLAQQSYEQLHFVLGMVNDKDISIILKELPKTAVYYFCKANIPRGLSADILQQQANRFDLKGHCFSSVKAAFEAAKLAANSEDCILIAGSIFVVAEVLP